MVSRIFAGTKTGLMRYFGDCILRKTMLDRSNVHFIASVQQETEELVEEQRQRPSQTRASSQRLASNTY